MRVRYPKKVYGPYYELSHQERDLNQFESLEHVLAFKMCSMKNICVQVLHTGSVQYYRTRSRCSISVALLVFKLCSIPAHMFLNTCKRSVPSDQLVFFLVKPFSTWCSNIVLSPLTLWCSILQNTFKALAILAFRWCSKP